MRMNRTSWAMITCIGMAGYDQFADAPRVVSCVWALPYHDETKFSKQSALAVKHNFRDNQHQSTGMSKFALA